MKKLSFDFQQEKKKNQETEQQLKRYIDSLKKNSEKGMSNLK